MPICNHKDYDIHCQYCIAARLSGNESETEKLAKELKDICYQREGWGKVAVYVQKLILKAQIKGFNDGYATAKNNPDSDAGRYVRHLTSQLEALNNETKTP